MAAAATRSAARSRRQRRAWFRPLTRRRPSGQGIGIITANRPLINCWHAACADSYIIQSRRVHPVECTTLGEQRMCLAEALLAVLSRAECYMDDQC